MRKDFTVSTYRILLEALLNKGFSLINRCEYDANSGMRKDAKRVVVLRQDVDRVPLNSLEFARIQHEMGIKSTFYFRTVPQSFQPDIIEKIAEMGHEIGYHYEDLTLVAKRRTTNDERQTEVVKGIRTNLKPVVDAGIESFASNLERLRKYADVRSVCMHGSPMSRWDSRLLWKYYDYREFGIDSEPYFDVDFTEMLYLTDTGRRWNGQKVSVRDKGIGIRDQGLGSRQSAVNSQQSAVGKGQRAKSKAQNDEEGARDQDGRQKYEGTENMECGTQSAERRAQSRIFDSRTLEKPEGFSGNAEPFEDWVRKPVPGSLMNMTEESAGFQARYNFRSTNDIIRAAEQGELPDKMMMTFHPQRWTDRTLPWTRELIWQNVKNVVKYFIVKKCNR